MITSIIAMIIAHFRMKSILELCLISSDSDCDCSFSYKGKQYDKEKFISIRADNLSSLSKINLQQMLNEEQKAIPKSKYPEFDQANIEAIEQALANK